jgi:hypothetical protein
MDKWFGSLHDGTPEADERFRAARMKAYPILTEPSLINTL